MGAPWVVPLLMPTRTSSRENTGFADTATAGEAVLTDLRVPGEGIVDDRQIIDVPDATAAGQIDRAAGPAVQEMTEIDRENIGGHLLRIVQRGEDVLLRLEDHIDGSLACELVLGGPEMGKQYVFSSDGSHIVCLHYRPAGIDVESGECGIIPSILHMFGHHGDDHHFWVGKPVHREGKVSIEVSGDHAGHALKKELEIES